jgi:predicted nucleic acid-binding protein
LILVDTSVWIDHLRKGIPSLAEALEREDVLMHPFVVGELACGELTRRREVLDLLSTLPSSIVATDHETLRFIENHRLMGKGIGYIDAHLLASVILTEAAQFWTRDKRLGAIAAKLRIAFERSTK